MKTALVTGASRGIGKSTAITLSRLGYRVIINYLKNDEAAKAVCRYINESGGEAYIMRADVSKADEAKEMFKNIEKLCKGIDILVNNAGISHIGLFNEMTEEEYDRVFAVNMKSAFLCSKLAVPYMINKKSGRIINISSMWGITGASCEAVYSASKAAVIGFTKALAQELAPSGITVNAVAPGVIDTDMNKNLTKEDISELENQTPLGRIGTPLEVAKAVAYLASEDSGFITGHVINISGGMVI